MRKGQRLKTVAPRVAVQPGRLATLSVASWRTGRTTAERGYGGRWQRRRAAHLAAHPLCVMCEGRGRVTVATVVDHRIPHRGNQALFWDESNWQGLCKPCHDSVKRAIENKEARNG